MAPGPNRVPVIACNMFANELVEVFAEVLAQTVEADDSEILKKIALAGGGIAYLPNSLIQRSIAQGELVSVLNNYISSEFELSLYFKPRKHMPARCANFKDFLIRRVDQISLEKQEKELNKKTESDRNLSVPVI